MIEGNETLFLDMIEENRMLSVFEGFGTHKITHRVRGQYGSTGWDRVLIMDQVEIEFTYNLRVQYQLRSTRCVHTRIK